MSEEEYQEEYNEKMRKRTKGHPTYIHVLLFIATFLSAALAGVNWAGKDYTNLDNFEYGILYGILVITFLTAHEFGHYIASRIHGVNATLPYYIPFPPTPVFPSLFGTFGAVIKTRSPIMTNKALFDIGVSGPIAGFIVALIFLIYGLLTLPGIEFIYSIHPEYMLLFNGQIPPISLHFGDTILYSFLSHTIANPNGFLPPMNEIYHYPFLNVGWFGLFVTSLNMIPIGQLDGGHVTYAMFGGEKQLKIAKIFWWIMMIVGGAATLGLVLELVNLIEPDSFFSFIRYLLIPPLTWIKVNVPWFYSGWSGWLFWGLITKFFIKLPHPTIYSDDKLDNKRIVIGWFALIILLLSFSYNGIYFVE